MLRSQMRPRTRVAIFYVQACHLPARRRTLNVDVDHALFKTNFTAQCNDLLAQVFYHLHQFESANVRVRRKQNVAWSAGLHKLVHDLAT